jgi:predicted nucleic acid-binding protein
VQAKLLISDANVIIDLEVGGLIKQMFRLDYGFAVPDVLYETELKGNHANLPKLGLKRLELQPEAVEYTAKLAEKYRKPGRIDLMALALAKQEQCRLLTGDQALRDAGNAEGMAVVGTIWLVGEMLRAKIITKKEARAAYNKMKESNRRLPWTEAEKQMKEHG